MIVARGGRIAGVEVADGKPQRFALRGGNVFEFTADGKEIPLDLPDVFTPLDDRIVPRGFQSTRAQHRQVKGIVLRDGKLYTLIVSDDDLPFKPAREPRTVLVATRMSGGVPRVNRDETVTLFGKNFKPSAPVRVSVTNGFRELQTMSGTANAKGEFKMSIVASGIPGKRTVSITQQDGKRLTASANDFYVAGADAAKTDSVTTFKSRPKR
jgi:hypothetical protein